MKNDEHASGSSDASTTLEGERAAKDWILVNPKMLVGLVGAAACYAWLFIMLGTSAFLLGTDSFGGAAGMGHLACILGSIVALVVCWVFSSVFSTHRLVEFCLSAGFVGIGCVGLLFANEAVRLVWVPAFCLGLGFGFLYPLYGELVCTFFYGQVRSYVQGIFLAASLACCGLLFTDAKTGFFFAAIFPLMAIVSYLFVLIVYRLDARPAIDRKESDGRSCVTWRSYLSTVTSGMAVGFALGYLVATETLHSQAYVLVEILVFATCLFMFVDSLKWHKVNEAATMRLFLPCAALVVLPLIFVSDVGKFIFALLLLCGSLLPTTCSISAICKHIVICNLSAIRTFSFGRMMSFLGMLLGMGLAFLGFAPFCREWFGDLATAASVVSFMLLVIFSASFVMTEDNYPKESRFHARGEKEGEGLEAEPGTPIRKIAAVASEDAEDGHAESAEHSRPRLFHVKCDIVSERYGLSNRQREVLAMLAKGRNADYITEKLVISPHTAKAHIYNIYQKTGVHSRQELMDLVENAEVDGAALSKGESKRESSSAPSRKKSGGGGLIPCLVLRCVGAV